MGREEIRSTQSRERRSMKNSRSPLLINCITIVIVAMFLILPFLEKPSDTGYDIVFLGDSVIGNTTGTESVADIVAEDLGKRAFNGAFGGTTLSLGNELLWGSVTNAQWSMVRLAEAIAYEDWKSQIATMSYADSYREVNLQALPYFAERMQALSEIDFGQVEILVIEHGTNDYNCGRCLDNPEDKYDINTFGGAMRYSIELLQKAYPDLQIVLLSPIYCELGEKREIPSYIWNAGYGTLDDYVALEKEIAREYDVMFLDAYHESGIGEGNAKEFLYDGLHLTTQGTLMLGEYVAENLKELPIN